MKKGSKEIKKSQRDIIKTRIYICKITIINEFWINKNYFRKDLLYDSSIPKFKSLNEAGQYPMMATTRKK